MDRVVPRIDGLAVRRRVLALVVASVGFPVESGFAKRLARPGGNITGFAVLADDLSMNRLALLKELMPSLSRLAVLRDQVTHKRGSIKIQVGWPPGSPGASISRWRQQHG